MERSGGRRGWDAHNCRATANGTSKAGPAEIPGCTRGPARFREITRIPSYPRAIGAPNRRGQEVTKSGMTR